MSRSHPLQSVAQISEGRAPFVAVWCLAMGTLLPGLMGAQPRSGAERGATPNAQAQTIDLTDSRNYPKETLQQVTKNLTDGNLYQKRDAALELGSRGAKAEAALPALHAILLDPGYDSSRDSVMVTRAAVEAVAKIGQPQSVIVLLDSYGKAINRMFDYVQDPAIHEFDIRGANNLANSIAETLNTPPMLAAIANLPANAETAAAACAFHTAMYRPGNKTPQMNTLPVDAALAKEFGKPEFRNVPFACGASSGQ